MSDDVYGCPPCRDCGLAILPDESRLLDFGDPPSLHHAPGVCAKRLRALLEDVRERAARKRELLYGECRAALCERDEARRERDAALAVVDAARRLVEFLRDSDSVVTGYAPVAHALAVALAALPAREPRDGNVEVPRG